MKKLIENNRDLIIATLCTLTPAALMYAGWNYATQERSSTSIRMEWTGKAWKADEPLPSTINSPFGFMHTACLVGESYTLVVPNNVIGNSQVRIHIWSNGKSY